MEDLTLAEKQTLAELAKLVLLHPDLADELAESAGATEIAQDPTLLALEVVHAAVLEPKNFDTTIQNYLGDEEYLEFWAAAGAALTGLAGKIGGMFKKGKGGKAKGFLGKIFGKVKDKLGNWKDNRQIKKDLKASGDPNWREQWRNIKDMQKGRTGKDDAESDWTRDDNGGTGGGGDRGNVSLEDIDPDTPDKFKDIMVDGSTVSEDEVKKGIATLIAQEKQIKMMRIVSISLGVAFLGALAWALLKK